MLNARTENGLPQRQSWLGWRAWVWLFAWLMLTKAAGALAESPISRGRGGPVGAFELNLPTPGFETDPRFGSKTLIVYAPTEVHAGPARPLILLLHGTAGSPFAAIQQARNVRTFWQTLAESAQIVLVAPTASGNSGGWLAPVTSTDRPTDYDAIDAALGYATSHYNIRIGQIYVWGFSSGGHVALDLGLNRIHPTLNRRRFAAFAVNAGAMEGLACPPNDASACQAVADAAAPFPLSVVIGESDPLFPRVAADYKRLIQAGWSMPTGQYRSLRFAGGHTVLADQPAWHWENLRRWVRVVPKVSEAEPIMTLNDAATRAIRPSQDTENKEK